MSSCLSCFEEIKDSEFKLQCNCNICLECFTEWIIVSIKDTIYNTDEKYTCPNFKCKIEISKDWIIQNIGTNNQEKINDILLLKYTTNNKDIQKCPRVDCRFAGYLVQNCKEEFQCDLCSYKWKPQRITIFNFFNSNFNLYNEFSDLRVNILSRPCFHCGKYISKIQGCDHITCVCKGEFCYNCLKNWVHHDQSYCNMKRDIIGTNILFILIVLILKFVTSFAIIRYLLWNLIWLISINLIMILIIIFNWFITYYSMKYNKQKFCSISIIIQLSLIYLYYIYYEDDFYFKLKIIGLELIVFIAGGAIAGTLLILRHVCKRR